MPQYQLFTPAWWMTLTLNLIALPLGWLALYYVAPALGDAVGAGLAVLLFVAVPLAILAVMVWRILVPLVLKRAPWTFLIVGAQIEPEGAATYSVANLFSLAKLPYKLHSLTGILLE